MSKTVRPTVTAADGSYNPRTASLCWRSLEKTGKDWILLCEQNTERAGLPLLAGYLKDRTPSAGGIIVQELCESRGGRPELSVLTSLLVSVDVKLY